MAAKDLQLQLNDILNTFDRDFKKAMNDTAKKVAKDCAADLKANSPGDGDYSGGWKASKDGTAWVVHNASKPGLTHLLNNGHLIRNQYGIYDFKKGDNHIGKVEQKFIPIYEDAAAEAVEEAAK